MKLYQVIDFPTVFAKIKNQKLPFKTSYQLTMLAREIEKHHAYYQEQFQSLLLEYSVKDENGNPKFTEDGQGILLVEETTDEAYSKLEELRGLDIELPEFKFSIDSFGDIELSPEEMAVLIPFIQD